MTSQARIEANRRNAAKSTGPRTKRGKARSRRNGVVSHGLGGRGVVLTRAEKAEQRRRLRAWAATLRPADGADHAALERAVLASVVLDRVFVVEMAEWAGLAEDADTDAGPLLAFRARYRPRWSRLFNEALTTLRA